MRPKKPVGRGQYAGANVVRTVVRTVAWAEVAPPVAGLIDRNAAQVGADAQYDGPLLLLHSIVVRRRVA